MGAKIGGQQLGPQARKMAEIYVENHIKGLGKSQTTMKREAGYSEATDGTRVLKNPSLKMEIERLLPKDKILNRVNLGLEAEKDSTALGYCKLGAEIHGLVGARTSLTVNAENANIMLADLVNWQAPGEEPAT